MLLTRIVYATVTGRIDCDENHDHEYCKGDKGKNEVPFCDLDYQELGFTVCRDRDVNPDVDCDVKSDDSLCNSERGRDGLIFCDLLYQKTGGKTVVAPTEMITHKNIVQSMEKAIRISVR